MNPVNYYIGTCPVTGKRQYNDRRTAKTVAKQHPGKVHPYRCLQCGYIHLGGRAEYSREWHRQKNAEKYGATK